jgi:hypothetical protein
MKIFKPDRIMSVHGMITLALLLIILLCFCFVDQHVSAESSEAIKVLAIIGAEFKVLPHKTVYQSTYPLLFTADWSTPSIHIPLEKDYKNNKPIDRSQVNVKVTSTRKGVRTRTKPVSVENKTQNSLNDQSMEIPVMNAYQAYADNRPLVYDLLPYVQLHVEQNLEEIPVGNWLSFLKRTGKQVPDFLLGIEPYWTIRRQRFWPLPFQIALFEVTTNLTLPDYHPDAHFKNVPLGILRLMSRPTYDRYQELLTNYSAQQLYVPYGNQLPMNYVDFRAQYYRVHPSKDMLLGESLLLSSPINENDPLRIEYRAHLRQTKRAYLEAKLRRQRLEARNTRAELSNHTISRQRRGVLSWCCDVIYKSDIKELTVDKDRIENYMELVKTSLTGEEQQISKLDSSLKSLDQQVETDMAIIRKNLGNAMDTLLTDTKDLEVLHGVQTTLVRSVNHLLLESEYNQRNISIAECRSGHIPRLIISAPKLKQALIQLETDLKKDKRQYELAIPSQDTSQYYKLETSSCMDSNETLFIQTKVPLKRVGETYQVYSVLLVPFIYNSTVCHFVDLPEYVAVSEKKSIRILNANTHSDCIHMSTSLCMLPQYPQTYQSEEECLSRLFFGAHVPDIIAFCHFKCKKRQLPVITQVKPHQFSILNPSNYTLFLNVKCNKPKQVQEFKVSPIGSYSLQLSCGCIATCKLHGAPTLTIESPFPCDLEMSPDLMLTHNIPIYWLKESEFFVSNESNIYISTSTFNLSTLMHTDLSFLHGANIQEKLDTINTTLALQNLKVPVLFNMDLETSTNAHTIWLSVLTIVFGLAIIYVFYKLCQFAFTPAAQYRIQAHANLIPPTAPAQIAPINIPALAPMPVGSNASGTASSVSPPLPVQALGSTSVPQPIGQFPGQTGASGVSTSTSVHNQTFSQGGVQTPNSTEFVNPQFFPPATRPDTLGQVRVATIRSPPRPPVSSRDVQNRLNRSNESLEMSEINGGNRNRTRSSTPPPTTIRNLTTTRRQFTGNL